MHVSYCDVKQVTVEMKTASQIFTHLLTKLWKISTNKRPAFSLSKSISLLCSRWATAADFDLLSRQLSCKNDETTHHRIVVELLNIVCLCNIGPKLQKYLIICPNILFYFLSIPEKKENRSSNKSCSLHITHMVPGGWTLQIKWPHDLSSSSTFVPCSL